MVDIFRHLFVNNAVKRIPTTMNLFVIMMLLITKRKKKVLLKKRIKMTTKTHKMK